MLSLPVFDRTIIYLTELWIMYNSSLLLFIDLFVLKVFNHIMDIVKSFLKITNLFLTIHTLEYNVYVLKNHSDCSGARWPKLHSLLPNQIPYNISITITFSVIETLRMNTVLSITKDLCLIYIEPVKITAIHSITKSVVQLIANL